MSERRGTGEGSVYRRPDGLWVAAVELPRGLDGKRRRRVVKARTKREVLARVEQVRKHASEGVVPDRATSVGSYLEWWLDNACGHLKPATLANYRITVSRHVKPYLATVRLAQLSPLHVRTMLAGLESAGYSANTRRLARSVLRRALGLAERDGLVARNVASLTDGPSVAGTRLDDAFDAVEAARVIDVARGDRLEALASLVLTLGLRRGEALGLRWTDVDFDAKTLTIERTLARVPGQGLVTTSPKTATGARTVPLVGNMTPVLRERRRRQSEDRLRAGPAWQEGGWVFTTPLGLPLDPRNALRWWHGLCKRAGLGQRRFHASRHTAATLLLDRGVPLEVVSAILGHASLAITADVYARVTMDSKRRALEPLSAALEARL
jgi:integrase